MEILHVVYRPLIIIGTESKKLRKKYDNSGSLRNMDRIFGFYQIPFKDHQ